MEINEYQESDDLKDFSVSQHMTTVEKWDLSKKFITGTGNINAIRANESALEPKQSYNFQFSRKKNNPVCVKNPKLSHKVSKYKIKIKSTVPSNDATKEKPRKFLAWLVPRKTLNKLSANNLKGDSDLINYEKLTEYQLNIIGDKSHNISTKDNQVKDTRSGRHSSIEEFQRHFLEKKIKDSLLLKFFPVIHPEGRLKLYWNIFICLCILFQCFLITIELFFDINWHKIESSIFQANLYISQSFKYIFVLDVTLGMFTGFYFQGIVVMNPYKILKNYAKKLLIVDLMAIFPIFLDYSDTFSQDEHISAFHVSKMSFFKLLFFLRLIKLRRTFYYIEIMLSNHEKVEGILSLFKLSLNILFTAHLFACIWYFLGDLSIRNNHATWLSKAFADPMNNNDWRTFYLYSLYWSITTMITVGYGDITPANTQEVGFVICSMIIGCGLFGYSLSNIGSIFEKFFSQENEIKAKLRVINRYMKRKEIDFVTQGKVRRYLNYILKETLRENSEKELELINKLSISLKKELLLQANGKILLNCAFFKNNFSLKTIQKLSELIVPMDLAPEDYVFEEGSDNCDNLYLVSKGKVDLFLYCDNPNKDSFLKLRSLGVGDIFGESSFLTSKPRECSAISVGYTKLFSLSKSKFLEVLLEDFSEFENYCKIRDTLLIYNDFSPIMNICYSCEKDNHSILSCPSLKYIPNKIQILENFRKKKKKNERKKHPRHLNRATHPLRTMGSLALAKARLGEEYDLDEYHYHIEKLKQDCMNMDYHIFEKWFNNDDDATNSSNFQDQSLEDAGSSNKEMLEEKYLSKKNTVVGFESGDPQIRPAPVLNSPTKKSIVSMRTGFLKLPTNNCEDEQKSGAVAVWQANFENRQVRFENRQANPEHRQANPDYRQAYTEMRAGQDISPRGERRKKSFWEHSLSRQSSILSTFKTKAMKTGPSESEEFKEAEASTYLLNNQAIKLHPLQQTQLFNLYSKDQVDISLFDHSFDTGKNFKKYFPHNNPQFVVEKFKKRLSLLMDPTINYKENMIKKSERRSISMGQAPVNLRKRQSKLARLGSDFK